jgi:hypothetical protein
MQELQGKNTRFVLDHFFSSSENHAIYEINVDKYGRGGLGTVVSAICIPNDRTQYTHQLSLVRTDFFQGPG